MTAKAKPLKKKTETKSIILFIFFIWKLYSKCNDFTFTEDKEYFLQHYMFFSFTSGNKLLVTNVVVIPNKKMVLHSKVHGYGSLCLISTIGKPQSN